MNTELLIPLLTFGGTFLLVLTCLLNFSVFVKQLRAAREQLETARRQLESARPNNGLRPVPLRRASRACRIGARVRPCLRLLRLTFSRPC